MQVCDSYAERSRNALLSLFNYEFCRVLSSWISENILICAEISLCFQICPTTMQKVSDSSDEPEAQKKAGAFRHPAVGDSSARMVQI